jgi:WD40 repeat protein
MAVLRGHEEPILSVAYAPDGARIASGAHDKTVRLWDGRTGAELAVLRGHDDTVNCVTYSPDGERIASGSRDYTMRTWDASSGEQLTVSRCSEVLSLSYSADGKRLATGVDSGVEVWDARTGAERTMLWGPNAQGVSYSPDGKRIAIVTGFKNTVRLISARSGIVLAEFFGWCKWASSVSYSPDGKRIASGSFDECVEVWDADSRGRCLETIRGFGDLQAIAAGSQAFPLRAVARDLETAVERADDGRAVSWFPVALSTIVTDPSDRCTWAGAAGSYLCLFTLEGGNSLRPRSDPQAMLTTPSQKKRPWWKFWR